MIITGGIYKGRKIVAPDENITRPTLSKVRMGVFNTLFSIIGDFENKTFLDMFGGSGIIGIEALSRGFENATVIEKNLKSAQIIKKNYEVLGIKPSLLIGDSVKLLAKTSDLFDVIYVDPPYMSGIYEKSFEVAKSHLKASGILIAEHSEEIITNNYELLKTKNYGGKKVSFYKT